MDLLYTKTCMIIIGHRGAKGQAPENTLAAIQAGLGSGVQEIEIDARITSDDVVILGHEDHIGSTTIADSTFRQLLKIQPDLATLDSAIKLINKKVPIYLEVKPGVAPGPVVAVINSYLSKGWKPDHFLFASFSYPLLEQLHAELPQIPVIINEMWSGVRATFRARKMNTKRISIYRYSLWSGFISAMTRRGYHISVFPLNDVDKANKWAKRGLYGVITDYPERFTGKS
jgi:glycerophosphoryl diester phosphodiesterase